MTKNSQKSLAIPISEQVNIKILNAGAWTRSADRVPVSLPRELEDFIPEVEDFYRSQHSGRKLRWHHHMSNGTVSCVVGNQLESVYVWNGRLSYEILVREGPKVFPSKESISQLWKLEDFIPEVEDFYRSQHSGRKLRWHHHMSNGTVSCVVFQHSRWWIQPPPPPFEVQKRRKIGVTPPATSIFFRYRPLVKPTRKCPVVNLISTSTSFKKYSSSLVACKTKCLSKSNANFI